MGLEGNDLSSPGGMAVGQELGQGLGISAALHPLSMNTGLVSPITSFRLQGPCRPIETEVDLAERAWAPCAHIYSPKQTANVSVLKIRKAAKESCPKS